MAYYTLSYVRYTRMTSEVASGQWNGQWPVASEMASGQWPVKWPVASGMASVWNIIMYINPRILHGVARRITID